MQDISKYKIQIIENRHTYDSLMKVIWNSE